MTLAELHACVRGFARANGACDAPTQADFDEYYAAAAFFESQPTLH